jgi:homoserine O-acetyltransferase
MTLQHSEFALGDLALQCGEVLPDAKIVYKTYGSLNEKGDNAIVYPTWFSGQHTDNEWLIGEEMALNPNKYFIVVPNMFGNGLSTSPSNRPDLTTGREFPLVTPYDNVKAQHRLLTEKLGVSTVALATGWSMGAQQAYHWGALFPDMVERLMPFCGSARTADHNWVFLDGVRAVLWLAANSEESDEAALRAAGRVYAGWAFSQSFYREQLWASLGFPSLEDFISGFWDGFFVKRNRLDLLAMINTWQNADISNNQDYRGDLKLALSSITAKTVVMPSRTDLYFKADDSRLEVPHLQNGQLLEIDTVWGHAAGVGLNKDDSSFINSVLRKLLSDEI